MRFVLALALTIMPCAAVAQVQPTGADRSFPPQFAVLLSKLSKAQAAKMQSSANEYCKKLDYAAVHDLYNDVSQCTLMQSTAILSVDTALFSLDHETPTKHRPDQIKKCWALYKALGSGDVENLDHCFGDIEYFETLQRVAGSEPQPARPTSSSYCDRVAQVAGGSYVILEECMKQEDASRRRLGR